MGGILCNYVNCCAKGLAYISTNYLTKYYNFEISNCLGGGGVSWLCYIKKLGEIGEYHNSLPIINSIITNRMGLFKPNKFFSTLIFKNKFIIKILNFKDLKITLH